MSGINLKTERKLKQFDRALPQSARAAVTFCTGPDRAFIEPGDVLPNGATAIAYDDAAALVLAINEGATQPYVIWSVTRTQDRECHTGFYFHTFDTAARAWLER